MPTSGLNERQIGGPEGCDELKQLGRGRRERKVPTGQSKQGIGQRHRTKYRASADKNSIKHTTMRVLLFQTIAPGIPLAPQPVLTRWETWLDAVNYYADYYGKIMEVTDALDSTDSSTVAAVKSLPSELLLEDILFTDSDFKIVSKSITLLESSKLQLSEALNIVDKVSQTVIQNNNLLISEKVKFVWPLAPINGCRFHLCQASFRQIKELGLSTFYKNKQSDYGIWLRSIFGLTYLDPAEVDASFVDDFTSCQSSEVKNAEPPAWLSRLRRLRAGLKLRSNASSIPDWTDYLVGFFPRFSSTVRKHDAETDQEEEKEMVGSLTEKKLLTEGCTGRNDEREKVRGRRRYQMIDDITIHESYEETKRKAENRNDWRKLGLQ
ncbi:hypothetical protein ANN_02393 [Periplaneta americana]|uniref:Uncharacterized protein n=1 Tax=Periplaneta americana TaxID=6978 RepID=A0ABQ8TW86_PERAM|nr:hypothetical protein ANN_02393 [Periplaneta americana]